MEIVELRGRRVYSPRGRALGWADGALGLESIMSLLGNCCLLFSEKNIQQGLEKHEYANMRDIVCICGAAKTSIDPPGW